MAHKKSPESKVLRAHQKVRGKIETKSRVPLASREEFATFYTPGVGEVSQHLAAHPKDAPKFSIKGNSVAVVSDGTAVLGLGNIGPYGALPVMEGKALIFKSFANIDAWPIVLDLPKAEGEERVRAIVDAVTALAPAFGGINLEDIKAPECFAVEEQLKKRLTVPVMHDDQHGTAIVVLAGLINAAKVVKKPLTKLRVVIAGAGAAGTAVALLLKEAGVADIVVTDRQGVIYKGRPALSPEKKRLASATNPRKVKGTLLDALHGADVFVGLSGPGLLAASDIETMAERPIVFALSNPVPEIMPDMARKGGAAVVATGRSDFPNQINNALVFPGIFRGALDQGVREITTATKLHAARALAALIKKPHADMIIPDVFDPRVVKAVARSVRS